MWNQAQEKVQEVFFKDRLRLYKKTYTETEIGEDIESFQFVGSFPCNVQSVSLDVAQKITGEALTNMLRISTLKSIPLEETEKYAVELSSVRLQLKPGKKDVKSWIEAQISTVIMVSDEAII